LFVIPIWSEVIRVILFKALSNSRHCNNARQVYKKKLKNVLHKGYTPIDIALQNIKIHDGRKHDRKFCSQGRIYSVATSSLISLLQERNANKSYYLLVQDKFFKKKKNVYMCMWVKYSRFFRHSLGHLKIKFHLYKQKILELGTRDMNMQLSVVYFSWQVQLRNIVLSIFPPKILCCEKKYSTKDKPMVTTVLV